MKMNGIELTNMGRDIVNLYGDRSWRTIYYNPHNENYYIKIMTESGFMQVYRWSTGYSTSKNGQAIFKGLPEKARETLLKIAKNMDAWVDNDERWDKQYRKMEGYIRCLNDLGFIASSEVITLSDYVVDNYKELMV